MFTPKLVSELKTYSKDKAVADLFAGLTVGVVALPLAMAFAIASGLPPERGLYTAIVAGFLISALGGSKVQIGGPTGAFVVIVSAILLEHGTAGLAVATLMAGLFLWSSIQIIRQAQDERRLAPLRGQKEKTTPSTL